MSGDYPRRVRKNFLSGPCSSFVAIFFLQTIRATSPAVLRPTLLVVSSNISWEGEGNVGHSCVVVINLLVLTRRISSPAGLQRCYYWYFVSSGHLSFC